MLPEIMESMDLLDDARINGRKVKAWLLEKGAEDVVVTRYTFFNKRRTGPGDHRSSGGRGGKTGKDRPGL